MDEGSQTARTSRAMVERSESHSRDNRQREPLLATQQHLDAEQEGDQIGPGLRHEDDSDNQDEDQDDQGDRGALRQLSEGLKELLHVHIFTFLLTFAILM